MSLDRHEQAADVGQCRHHACRVVEPASARPQEGQRCEQCGDHRRQPGGKLVDAEHLHAGGHAPVHEHRLVDGERAVVGGHDPVARLDHRAGDSREPGLVLIPEGRGGGADREGRDRGEENDEHGAIPRHVRTSWVND